MSPMAVLLAAALFSGDGASAADKAPAANPKVTFETSLGTFVLELDRKKAPISVENFLGYVRSGHFNGTIFHRVILGFMVQGGGFDAQMSQKRVGAPIENEAKNGLKNDRGTIAMARTGDPNSATSQFFINTVNNDGLNRPKPDGHGYAVFGHVITGMDVVDKIEKVRTTTKGGQKDVPVEPVVIVKATIQE
jgi:peptidyl-prolyl cis-trans isomerase A (cyclophilin A)